MTVEERTKMFGLIERHAVALGEFFDAVQIVATTTDDKGTYSFHEGSGNFFARQGLAHEFIKNEEATQVGRAVANSIP